VREFLYRESMPAYLWISFMKFNTSILNILWINFIPWCAFMLCSLTIRNMEWDLN